MKIGVVIAAAGLGRRLQYKTPKPFVKLGNYPILYYCLKLFNSITAIDFIIIMSPANLIERCERLILKYKFKKVKYIEKGGLTRQQSIYKGIKLIKNSELLSDKDLIFVHDAVRPFTKRKLVEHLLNEITRYDAVIPALPVSDTVKKIDKGSMVKETIDRASIWLVQTPQLFKYPVLLKSYDNIIRKAVPVTDDAMACEMTGFKVRIIPGNYYNIKITTQADLPMAKLLLNIR